MNDKKILNSTQDDVLPYPKKSKPNLYPSMHIHSEIISLLSLFPLEIRRSLLSAHKNLDWSIDFIDVNKSNWNWELLSKNNYLPWSHFLVKKFADYWNKETFQFDEGLGVLLELEGFSRSSPDYSIQLFTRTKVLTAEFISNYEKKWDWHFLSNCQNIEWSVDLIEKYKHNWCWDNLSGNETLPWSTHLIELFKNNWNWSLISENESFPWSLDFFEKFIDNWNWSNLSQNQSLPWSVSFFEKYIDQWDWNLLSQNESIPWSFDLIEKYSDKWDWSALSLNEKLPWSIDLIKKYSNKWDWNNLSDNEAIPWSPEFLSENCNKFNWEWISSNEGICWTLELLEKYDILLNWHNLSGNRKLPWSLELIEKYSDKWFWGESNSTDERTFNFTPNLVKRLSKKNKCLLSNLSKNEGIPWSYHLIKRISEKLCFSSLSDTSFISTLDLHFITNEEASKLLS